jgi:hypothetical protein
MAFDPLSMIGLSEKDAVDLLKKNGIVKWRVAERNGEAVSIQDSDYNQNRFSLFIDNDKVYRFVKG